MLTSNFGGDIRVGNLLSQTDNVVTIGNKKVAGQDVFNIIKEYGDSLDEVIDTLIDNDQITDYFISGKTDLIVILNLPTELFFPSVEGKMLKASLVVYEAETSKDYPIVLFNQIHDAHRNGLFQIDE